jgi:hypothetical protein
MHQPAAKLNPSAVRPEHRALYKYLENRYAHRVLLTFSQIEDFLETRLPEEARRTVEWWADMTGDSQASPQSHAWGEANRTATPNLRAETVLFERRLE